MDQAKLIVYLSLATAALLGFGYKVVNKWIDEVSSKLNKIAELETNHILLKNDVNAIGQKLNEHITVTNSRLEDIERHGRQTKGLVKRTYIAVKELGSKEPVR